MGAGGTGGREEEGNAPTASCSATLMHYAP